jgi:threonyl-tRNA synthetase
MDEQLDKMRHSATHVMMQALERLYDAIPGVGPSIENGFYHDFDTDHKVSSDDLKTIEKEMKKIVKEKLPIERSVVKIDEGIKILEDKGYTLTAELARELKEKGEKEISFYKQGEFINMCRGEHMENTGQIGNFKLLSVAGAYWRGDEKNKMLQRIYGVSFNTKEELKNHLALLEEAKKRDHRKIGADQKLFFIDDIIGKGLVMWQPNGTIIRNEIEKLANEVEDAAGYKRVVTPHLAKEELYLTSGHLPYYKEGMYPAMEMDDGTYYLKAMNCPHHHVMYGHNKHSYRDLPLRLAEYGVNYRNELSGTLAGLLRVRGMDMNDAHIYCTKDQIKDEFKSVIEITLNYFKLFGLTDYSFRLSKWSHDHKDKYIDEPDNWEHSQTIIKEVMDEMKLDYVEAEDEAAFYGPKIDIQYKSIIGREETMSTVQLDFLAKQRFNLTYTDKEGKENNEVFVIHRAPLSTHERFIAFLIEHYGGIWPTWLSPLQVKVIPVSEKFNDYGHKIKDELAKAGVRVELDDDNESLGKRIRVAEKAKTPYILVVGEKEETDNTIAVRKRSEGDTGSQTTQQFVTNIAGEIKDRK